MNKSPLIEMAGEYEFIVSLKGRHPAMRAHNPEYSSNARILRAADAVIKACKEWDTAVPLDLPALRYQIHIQLQAYEAACKEVSK